MKTREQAEDAAAAHPDQAKFWRKWRDKLPQSAIVERERRQVPLDFAKQPHTLNLFEEDDKQ